MYNSNLLAYAIVFAISAGAGMASAAEFQLSSPGGAGSAGNRGCLNTTTGVIPSVEVAVTATSDPANGPGARYLRAAGGAAARSASVDSVGTAAPPIAVAAPAIDDGISDGSSTGTAAALVERIPPHRWQSLVPGAIK
ncbi:MAG: hypothetical protein ABI451_06730 [Dokdonella sp.]